MKADLHQFWCWYTGYFLPVHLVLITVLFGYSFGTSGTHDVDPKVLLGVVEACLHEFRQIIVLGSADKARDVGAGQGAGAGVQVVEQDAQGVCLELYYRELE